MSDVESSEPLGMCVVCEKYPAVTECAVCERALCEDCALTCDSCHDPLCADCDKGCGQCDAGCLCPTCKQECGVCPQCRDENERERRATEPIERVRPLNYGD